MDRHRRGWFWVLACLALGGCKCSEPSASGWAGEDERLSHPARNAGVWGDAPGRPLDQRLVRCPAAVIDFVRKDNQQQGFQQRPTAVEPTPEWTAEISSILENLPPALEGLVASRLVGICLVEDLGGSAYTMMLFDEDRRPDMAAILLDAGVLDRTANEWFTWREQSPFQATGPFRLRATIATPERDTRKTALRYILLHEFGHVLQVRSPVMPNWLERLDDAKLERYAFLRLSWGLSGGTVQSRWDRTFPLRRRVHYYRPPNQRLHNEHMPEVFEQLATTGFPTLYAATSWRDDFADSLANFVHVVVDGMPYGIEVLRDGRSVFELGSCWSEQRCASKRRGFERLLRVSPPDGGRAL